MSEEKKINKEVFEIVINKTTWIDKKKSWAPLKSEKPTTIMKNIEYSAAQAPVMEREYHVPTTIIETEEDTTQIYNQKVETLDIAALIRVINRIDDD